LKGYFFDKSRGQVYRLPLLIYGCPERTIAIYDKKFIEKAGKAGVKINGELS